jgi:hypothetical protein
MPYGYTPAEWDALPPEQRKLHGAQNTDPLESGTTVESFKSSAKNPADPSFFASLYDLSFHTFITPKIIQVVYVLCLIIIGLISLGFLLSGFRLAYVMYNGYSSSDPTLIIIGTLIVAPIIFVVGSIGARLSLEFVIAVFRIAENTESLRLRSEQASRP